MWKYKTYSSINLLGLFLGIAICLLIYQYTQFELSFDKFHQNADNIYRVKLEDYQNDVLFSSQVVTPNGLGSAIKEIGIRKVLGASIRNIMFLLSKEYILLMLISGVIAIPVIWTGIQLWLESYAYRISPGDDFILIPFFIISIIALVTIGFRTFHSANANPVETLRKE